MGQKKLYQPHYSTTTDARVVQTRQALRRALLELIATAPLERITIRQIAARADVSYNTFFRHYKDKDELVKELITDELSQLIELSISTLDATDSSEAARALCHFVERHEALWSTLLTGGAANTLRDEFIRLLRHKAPSRVSGTSRLPVDIGVKLVAVGTLELLTWWLEQSERLPAEQIADIFEQLVVVPVVSAYAD